MQWVYNIKPRLANAFKGYLCRRSGDQKENNVNFTT
jgi:hypothetical protein